MPVYLPLRGPNAQGASPKACIVPGWNTSGYVGVDPEQVAANAWLGLRLDGLVVVDCDCACGKVGGRKPDVCATPHVSRQAYFDWRVHAGEPELATWTRKTPHGYHLIYRLATRDAGGAVQSRKLAGISPTLELKTGIGHQIVFCAPGYSDMGAPSPARLFDPAWLPPADLVRPADEWSELPDGIGDSFMISVAGKLREWGADEPTILACLAGVNTATMSRPMPDRSLRRIARSAARYVPGELADLTRLECPTCSTHWEGS